MPENKKSTRVPFGKSIEAQVSIQPYIETVHWPENRVEHYLRFDIKVNKGHANQYEPIAWFLIADGTHWGEQDGPEWEAIQLHWQKQYDYLKNHLERTTAISTIHLCGEACISERKDWDLEAILSDASFEELSAWQKKHTSANDKTGAWQWGERFRFQPHDLVLFHARHMWDRLKRIDGDDEDKYLEIETQLGSFSPDQHEKVLNQYPEYADKWKTARKIIKNNPNENDWRALLPEACSHFRFPEDLLSDLQETIPDKKLPYIGRPKYRPYQLALVHLAREAWLLNKDGTRLEAHQWQSIRRAINKFSMATGKPELKMPKE